MSFPLLKLDWVGHDAAKFACEHWHYSKVTPVGKLNACGVWENEKFIGCVLFSYGANNNMAGEYHLNQTECIELTRIALNSHLTPVTKIASIAIKMVRKLNPFLKLIVSYADANMGHYGIIYQGGNWIYVGTTKADGGQTINGKVMHRRSVFSKYGTNSTEILRNNGIDASFIKCKPKYKYLYPLTDDMRLKIEPLRKPYPKKTDKGALVVHSVSTPVIHTGEEGSIPIPTHMIENKDTFPGKEIRLIQDGGK